ncbi:MAG TPA: hypothetical protein VGP82_20815 [Ktedonobacterales bacterium]|jgi:hypothetical protein|nr:hypothetical protein [Ktedonobacterales bacterium]
MARTFQILARRHRLAVSLRKQSNPVWRDADGTDSTERAAALREVVAA